MSFTFLSADEDVPQLMYEDVQAVAVVQVIIVPQLLEDAVYLHDVPDVRAETFQYLALHIRQFALDAIEAERLRSRVEQEGCPSRISYP
jgi:hypothetical protein